MDNQSMREMNKDELIANLSLNDLADIIIMERQHIRELRQRNDKLVEMLQEQISDQTHKLAIADRALEMCNDKLNEERAINNVPGLAADTWRCNAKAEQEVTHEAE